MRATFHSGVIVTRSASEEKFPPHQFFSHAVPSSFHKEFFCPQSIPAQIRAKFLPSGKFRFCFRRIFRTS
jgi:hypothetical protein